MKDTNEVIGLLEDIEASLEDLRDSSLSNLQARVAELRERLTKDNSGYVYCLDDDSYFDWREKAQDAFKPLKSFELTLEIEIMAQNACDAQMNVKEMVDSYLDNKARLSQILKLRELSIDELDFGERVK